MDVCANVRCRLRMKNDGNQNATPYPQIDELAAPNANNQKLGFRSIVASTRVNAGALSGSAPSTRSRPPRTGSFTTSLNTGASTTPAAPTLTNAHRQFTYAAINPPNNTPSALPTGMPNE